MVDLYEKQNEVSPKRGVRDIECDVPGFHGPVQDLEEVKRIAVEKPEHGKMHNQGQGGGEREQPPPSAPPPVREREQQKNAGVDDDCLLDPEHPPGEKPRAQVQTRTIFLLREVKNHDRG